MKVLIACEFSGIVRDAFKAKGHDAWSCDLLESESEREHHILGDVRHYLVPPGFANDTFPARLSSGELVIERSDSQRLREFLDAQGGAPQNLSISLNIGEKQLADVLLGISRQGFRTA